MDKSDGKACWHCGQVRSLRKSGFCNECTVKNLDTMIISCECTVWSTKRRYRGQQLFKCKECKRAEVKL